MRCIMRHLNVLDMLRDCGKDHDDRQGFMARHWLEAHASDRTRDEFNRFVEEANKEKNPAPSGLPKRQKVN